MQGEKSKAINATGSTGSQSRTNWVTMPRVVQLRSGDRLLCKDSAVYVPKSARENILRTLHLCHHAPGLMIENTKGRIYWPEMRKQIHQVYVNCVECSLHKISKSRPPNECSQTDLFQNFFPNSFLQADYFDFRGGDYMTVVCTLTGYGRVFICKGKTTEEALRVIRQFNLTRILTVNMMVLSDHSQEYSMQDISQELTNRKII